MQVMLELARATVPIEAVACMSLVAAFDHAGMWPLAEAAFLTFFRTTGHFRQLDASPGQAEAAAHSCGEAVEAALRAASAAHLAKRAHESSPGATFCVAGRHSLHAHGLVLCACQPPATLADMTLRM